MASTVVREFGVGARVEGKWKDGATWYVVREGFVRHPEAIDEL